jgi:phosphoribosylanthranilate isomerase
VTLVKFCGMTREEDVDAAVTLGIDAVGFVLWPQSPRAVDPGRLPALVERVPASVLPVGVFVRPDEAEVMRALAAGVRVVQLHGVDARPSWAAQLEVWMAASLRDHGYHPAVPADCLLLLDAHDPARHGGTGQSIDWGRAAEIAGRRRVMLAGGLHPANVADAIRIVRPHGVDVASGIERRPGVKDADAMRAFVASARHASS